MQVHAVGVPTKVQGSGADSKPRLIQAAHEFEGQMLKELLKPLMASDGLTGDTSEYGSGDGSGGILGEFGVEALGKALSEQGGFGIADRIVGQLSRSGHHPGTSLVTGSPHFDTGMRTFKSLE